MSGSLAYLYGYPVGHSVSPPIHNAAFLSAGLDTRYSAIAVAPGGLPAAVERLREHDVLGANITVPHKEAVLGLVDEIDDQARAIGAANTIANLDGRLRASNTDALGFSRSLAGAGFVVRGQRTALLGAGGSARAVAQALLSDGASVLLIANRHPERAEHLADHLRYQFSEAAIRPISLVDLNASQLCGCALCVNTTTVGLHADESPLSIDLLPAGAAVVDIIYNPPRTRLLREAQRSGRPTLNGLSMLVHQAAASWETWTGRPAPLSVMFAAARRALPAVPEL